MKLPVIVLAGLTAAAVALPTQSAQKSSLDDSYPEPARGSVSVDLLNQMLADMIPLLTKRSVMEDAAVHLQQVLQDLRGVSHHDADLAKRAMVDIAHQIQGVIGEINHVTHNVTSGHHGVITQVNGGNHTCEVHSGDGLVSICHQIEGVIGQ